VFYCVIIYFLGAIMNFEYYFDKILNFYNVSTIKELGLSIDTGASTISNWKQRNSITALKKKCRELGIYNEIFGDSGMNKFYQTGENSQQVETQHNAGAGMSNSSTEYLDKLDDKVDMVDKELQAHFDALLVVAELLQKKDKLKDKLIDLITELPKM
jgi:hypothetical protein